MNHRKQLGRKWQLDLQGDDGGFGVGSDLTSGTTARLDWRFAKHLGMTFGYAEVHFEVSDPVTRRTLTIEPAIHGPTVGFGVHFYTLQGNRAVDC